MVRSFAFNIYFYALTVLAALVGIVVVPIPTPVLLRGLLHYWARAVVWGARWIGGMKIEIRGRQNLPAMGPALLANKHHSESDGMRDNSSKLATVFQNGGVIAIFRALP